MTLFQNFFLSFIQGVTEFLPISSSGHLVLIEKLFGWETQPTSFDVTIHGATLLAIIIYFHHDLIHYGKTIRSESTIRLLKNLVITTIPAALIGLLLKDFIDETFKQDWIILGAMIVIGIVFLISPKLFRKKNKTIGQINTKNSSIIGLFQPFAFIRGVSRSGITIIGGLTQGLDMEDAVKYSFLAGIPLLGLTAAAQAFSFIKSGFGDLSPVNLGFGFIVAFITGLAAIKILLILIKKQGLVIFGVYRIIFAVLLFFLLLK
jgi:undecaprenyl-diphosphatase